MVEKFNKEFADSNGVLDSATPEPPPPCGRNNIGFPQISQRKI